LALLQLTANDSKQGGNYILHMYSTAYRSQNITSLSHDNEDIQSLRIITYSHSG